MKLEGQYISRANRPAEVSPHGLAVSQEMAMIENLRREAGDRVLRINWERRVAR